jgi:hypothetical protein
MTRRTHRNEKKLLVHRFANSCQRKRKQIFIIFSAHLDLFSSADGLKTKKEELVAPPGFN